MEIMHSIRKIRLGIKIPNPKWTILMKLIEIGDIKRISNTPQEIYF